METTVFTGFEHKEDLEIYNENHTIKIKEEDLRAILKEAIAKAYNFGWTGWRIPIFTEEDGTLSAGSWISQNSWQPDAIEIISVESWNVDYENPTEEDLDYEVEERVDFMIDNFRFEDNRYNIELI